ncbi:MAG TPA: TPM domain-containing protein, partial [bacterium]|nr:TPM domain-containing protein [bacterium]
MLFKSSTSRWPGLALLLLLFVIFAAEPARALDVPNRPLRRISDFTGTLTPSQQASLDAKLQEFEEKTSNQIAVLLIPYLEGASLEDYSIRVAEKWKMGQKGKDNGVILLVSMADRKVRIEVGYGLEGALPDSVTGAIIRQELAPAFRQGDFYGGISRTLDAIMAATRGEYKTQVRRGFGPLGGRGLIGLLFFGAILLFLWVDSLLSSWRYASLSSRDVRLHRYPRSGFGIMPWFWGGGGGGGFGGGGFSGGGGGFGGG